MIQPNVDISVMTSQSSLNRLESLTHVRNNEKEIDKVAGEYEVMCYAHMVKSMFATTEDSAIWGESHASGILRSMFIDAIAHAGGAESLNIKASIKKSLYSTMDTENTPQPALNNHGEMREAVDVWL